MFGLRAKLETVLASGSSTNRRPIVGKGNESSVKGLHIIGDLAGAPVIKLAMAQGVEVVDYIGEQLRTQPPAGEGVVDVLIVGAGAAGLNAALAAQELGLSFVLLEKGKIANTIENFPEGKWVYAEPDKSPPKGKLWLDGATKEDLVRRWNQIITDNQINVRTEEPLLELERHSDGTFTATTEKGTYQARRIVLASGQRGNPRKLGVEGEEQEKVYHQLYSPSKYKNENILVVGGGNSAVEAALTLAAKNNVTISYRKDDFARLFKDNRRLLDEAVDGGRIEVVFNSNVKAFGDREAELAIDGEPSRTLPYDHAFVLVGAELPVKFLKSLGLRLENEWTGSPLRTLALTALVFLGLWFFGPVFGGSAPFGWSLGTGASVGAGAVALLALGTLVTFGARADKWAWLGISFFAWYSIYGIKVGKGTEFWPYQGWGYETLSFLDRPWAFWYTVLYTALMTIFGIQAVKRWGLDRRDKYQIWRFVSLISFQWVFFFIIPEFLFQIAVRYEWLGAALSNDPHFAEQAWRSYGIIYAWPLFFYTFFYSPHMVWVVWGVVLTFIIIPLFALFHGKRYCSWICGCGGLAETFGDRWRHLAPKGKTSVRLEFMNLWILIFAVAVTVLILGRDIVGLIRTADWGLYVYRIFVDVWLVGILPVTLYPFMGGKVWCRYWCPLAKFMGLFSKAYAKLGISRFQIEANDKCIACNECSRNCQVGIDVMSYALKQERLDNETSSCIGCGICVTVCPMDTLSFDASGSMSLPVLN